MKVEMGFTNYFVKVDHKKKMEEQKNLTKGHQQQS